MGYDDKLAFVRRSSIPVLMNEVTKIAVKTELTFKERVS